MQKLFLKFLKMKLKEIPSRNRGVAILKYHFFLNAVLKIFLILLVFGCKENPTVKNSIDFESRAVQNSDTQKHFKDSISSNPAELFQVAAFKKDIDSFLVDYCGTRISYNMQIDTITENNQKDILIDLNLIKYLVNNSKKLIHYAFKDEKSLQQLSFRTIEIQFIDSTQCATVFKTLERYANTKSAIENFEYVPCLTYQNDRLLKGSQKIFWLDNSCRFPFKTHQIYLKMFRNSLKNFTPTDSIFCKCGDVVSRK